MNVEALAARVALLSVAVQETARAQSRPQATQIAAAVRERADSMAGGLSPATDAALAGELAPLLAALAGER